MPSKSLSNLQNFTINKFDISINNFPRKDKQNIEKKLRETNFRLKIFLLAKIYISSGLAKNLLSYINRKE